jgi:PleD family two-component response regulator
MMTRHESLTTTTRTRTPRSVAVVGSQASPEALEAVINAVDYDVVLIESLTHAYAQIKRESPDLVIVCLNGEDSGGCQLLSMLRLDHQTARIPVLTYISAAPPAPGGDAFDNAAGEMLKRFVSGSLN